MIEIDSTRILDEILLKTRRMEDREAILEVARLTLTEHFDVSLKEVEWKDFRKPGYHVDPPGRFFVGGEPIKFRLTRLMI